MTTISMHAARSARFGNRPASRVAPRHRPVSPVRATSPVARETFRGTLGAASRLTLALVPFSFLAWMFVAN